MSNILDYIDWRGDLSFRKALFNEVDSLIFNRLSYLPLESLIKGNEEISIKELYSRFSNLNKNELFILRKEDEILLEKLAKSIRFKDLVISDFISVTLKEEEMQFAALTIHYDLNRKLYISFRGTDTTITGIKEDFNMNFLDTVPSEIYSKEYLKNISNKYLNQEIRLGGHSKGGRVAIYSAIFQDDKVISRIKKIYNDDGPGFNDKVINEIKKEEGYKKIINKVVTYIPESSLIGILFNHEEEVIIIKSTENGMKSHNIYNWEILGTNLIKGERLKESSKFLDKTFITWMKTLDIDTRKNVIDCVFDILSNTKIEKARDFNNEIVKNISTILKGYSNLTKENKKRIKETLGLLLKSLKDNALLEFKSSKEEEKHIKYKMLEKKANK